MKTKELFKEIEERVRKGEMIEEVPVTIYNENGNATVEEFRAGDMKNKEMIKSYENFEIKEWKQFEDAGAIQITICDK